MIDCRVGIFPSWGLSQRLQRAIGPYRARELSLTATPLDAHTAEKWGLVNRVVPPTELLPTARDIAQAILRNHDQLVLKYKAVINDGFKLPLAHALKLEQVPALDYYSLIYLSKPVCSCLYVNTFYCFVLTDFWCRNAGMNITPTWSRRSLLPCKNSFRDDPPNLSLSCSLVRELTRFFLNCSRSTKLVVGQ